MTEYRLIVDVTQFDGQKVEVQCSRSNLVFVTTDKARTPIVVGVAVKHRKPTGAKAPTPEVSGNGSPATVRVGTE